MLKWKDGLCRPKSEGGWRIFSPTPRRLATTRDFVRLLELKAKLQQMTYQRRQCQPMVSPKTQDQSGTAGITLHNASICLDGLPQHCGFACHRYVTVPLRRHSPFGQGDYFGSLILQ